jgi:hypothetical protein
VETQSPGNPGPNSGRGPVHDFPWGCLFGGCLLAGFLMLGGVAVTGFAMFQFYKKQLEKYTATEPQELPVITLPPEEVAAIEKRIEEFQTQVEQGVGSEELILTAEDINALIAKEEKLRGRVFVRINDGQVAADVSIPTDRIVGGGGRYFNGSVSVKVELVEGVLFVTVDQAEVNGLPVPEVLMEGLRRENLAKEMYKDVEAAKRLARIEKIEIGNDRIVLKVREETTPVEEGPSRSDAADAVGGADVGTSEGEVANEGGILGASVGDP